MQVAIYARVSTTRQFENDLSIPDQLRQVREWAKRDEHLVVREYIESGASATDDKRPVFQQMISDASVKPTVFDAIVVHSLSRFFRDAIQSGVYERRLKKAGVRIISITQLTPDDASGELMRQVINMFDEYQSKETAKHVSRAMCENARRGFFNGSAAPFGYKTVASETEGARGRKKKHLEINESEAATVLTIFRIYLLGLEGRTMGLKEIVKYLTERGQVMRGHPWRTQKVHDILCSRAYLGEHLYNVRDSKTGATRPPSEWIKVRSEAIIDPETFERVRALREARSPRKAPPRLVTNATLLTGLVKCECGAAMTLVTGKSGAYKYYKCTARMAKGHHHCTSRNLPMDAFDDLILATLAERILAPERLLVLMAELRKQVRESKESEQGKIKEIDLQVKSAEDRLNRLYEAVETGVLPLDATLQKRAEQLRTARDALLVELASVRRVVAAPMDRILPSSVEAFSRGIRRKLKGDKYFAKRYLQLLIDEIVVDDKTARIRGSNAVLAAAIGSHKEKVGTNEVPTFIRDWCARSDSNALPLGS